MRLFHKWKTDKAVLGVRQGRNRTERKRRIQHHSGVKVSPGVKKKYYQKHSIEMERLTPQKRFKAFMLGEERKITKMLEGKRKKGAFVKTQSKKINQRTSLKDD